MFTKKKSLISLCVLGLTTGLATIPVSVAQELPPPAYEDVEIDCLDNNIDIYRYNFNFSERNIITPSGIYHTVEYFEWDEVWFEPIYGSMWAGHGISPGAKNGVPLTRGVQQWTSHIKLTPVEGTDGPSFMYNIRFKLTANANGEPKVFFLPTSIDDWNIRCVGPK